MKRARALIKGYKELCMLLKSSRNDSVSRMSYSSFDTEADHLRKIRKTDSNGATRPARSTLRRL